MQLLPSLAEFRQTSRRLLRERGFSATVVLTLALCLAANVTIFAVVDAILVRSLPFPEPARLVTVINSYPGAGVERAGASLPNYYDRRTGVKAFASTSIYQGGSAIIGETGSPNRVDRGRVSPEFFTTLGVPLAMGRTFNEDEMFYKNSGVAIITDEFWHKNFNGDSQVIGRKFQVDTSPVMVIGVLPPGFRYLSSKAQFFVPAASDPKDRLATERHSNNFQLIARLAPDATLATARAQIDAFNAEQFKDDPYANLIKGAGYHTLVFLLHEDHVREVRPMLLLLQGGVLFLLLIGGVNLLNLLLIRASGRAKEMAVRQALGASRRHLVRSITFETLVLAVVGGLLGLLGGALGIRLIAALGTDRLPLGAEVQFDGRVAAFAFAGALLTGFALAVPVIWFSLRTRLAPVLQTESRGGTVSRAAQRLRHVFIVLQVALAFVLLSGAGLLGLSLQRVLATAPGFHPEHVLTGHVSLPWKNYPETKQRFAFVERLLAALRAQPGVQTAGLTSGLPMTDGGNDNAITVEGVVLAPGESIRAHYTNSIFGDYFQALGIPLVEGRLLEDADNRREQHVCLVDQDFAQRYWPGKSALGHRLTSGPTFEDKTASTIVGVVGNVKQRDLAQKDQHGAVYFPYGNSEYASSQLSIVLHTSLPPETLAPALQKIVLNLDPELPVDEMKPMQTWVDDSLVARRSPAVLAGIFAGVALLLAAIGTYGVLAYAVSQRRREIGVRMALGAMPRQVLAQFLGLGAKLLAVGIGAGVLGAWAVGRAMQGVLFGVGAVNPEVLVAAAVIMAAVVLLATFLPSRRASRVSPIEALRNE